MEGTRANPYLIVAHAYACSPRKDHAKKNMVCMVHTSSWPIQLPLLQVQTPTSNGLSGFELQFEAIKVGLLPEKLRGSKQVHMREGKSGKDTCQRKLDHIQISYLPC
jgi:hypothetical protein